MKRWFFLVVILVLTGCSEEIEGIDNLSKAKLGIFSQLDTSFTLYDDTLSPVHSWQFDEPYTGMSVLSNHRIMLFGFGLPEATIYDMETGRQLATLPVEEGVVAVYEYGEYVFVANSQTDLVQVYDAEYNLHTSVSTGKYPMSMAGFDNELYVINYQDEHVSVIDMDSLEIVQKWEVPKASQGILVTDSYLYIGGHGSGSKVNEFTTIVDRETGKMIDQLSTPVMPIDFVEDGESVYALSHGSNTLYQLRNQQVIADLEVAANPFAMGAIEDVLYIAGYDDDTLYVVKDMKVQQTKPLGDGPLLLFTEEAWQ